MLLRNGEAEAIAILMDGAFQANSLRASGAIAKMEAAAGAYRLRSDAAITRWQAGNVRAQGAYEQSYSNFSANINAVSGAAQLALSTYALGKIGGGSKPKVTSGGGGGGSRGSLGHFGSI